MKDMFIACWKVSSKIVTMTNKTLRSLFEDSMESPFDFYIELTQLYGRKR